MPEFPIHGSKYFDVREFVDQKTWAMLGVKSAWCVDPKIVAVCDLLREKVGVPVKINTWHYAKRGQKSFIDSGFRAKWSGVGGVLSQHRMGRAADVKVDGMSTYQIQLIIIKHEQEFLAAGLTTMENMEYTPTWCHLDCRPRLQETSGVIVVNP